jgi:hypothetical protein
MALLHLPALRPFWSQELRQQHFEAISARLFARFKRAAGAS